MSLDRQPILERTTGRWFTSSLDEARSYAYARGGYVVYVDVSLRLVHRWLVFDRFAGGSYFRLPQSHADTAERLTRNTPEPPLGTVRLYRGEWPGARERRLRARMLRLASGRATR